MINFLLTTEIIPLCLKIMESGSELSKTVRISKVKATLFYVVSRSLSVGCLSHESIYWSLQSLVYCFTDDFWKHCVCGASWEVLNFCAMIWLSGGDVYSTEDFTGWDGTVIHLPNVRAILTRCHDSGQYVTSTLSSCLVFSVIFVNKNENEKVKNEKITNSLTKTKTKTKKWWKLKRN